MTTDNNQPPGLPPMPPPGAEVAEPVIRKHGGLPIIWVIPLVAVLVAGWLVYQTFAETGPLVTLSFKNAAGVEAGKTRVRLKDVVVGTVESVKLGPKLDRVLVGVRMVPDSHRLLNKGASWWVVRPRITAREISGLNTLLSGAHIEMDPGADTDTDDKDHHYYRGLEEPPLVTSNEPGRRFLLSARSLGSVDVGSPIYFRRIPVGSVTKTELQSNGETIDVDLFIRAPYDKQVRKNTHFWNASGIDVEIGASGFKLRSQSLVSVLSGGVAFDVPNGEPRGKQAPAGTKFMLFDHEQAANQDHFAWNLRYLAYFKGSVRGLSAGAPVEFRGVRVGSVERIYLEEDPENASLRIAVQLNIQPERVTTREDNNRGAATEIAELVRHGLRAQLRTGSLLTGQRFVALDMHPDTDPAKILSGGKYPILPTIPETLEAITARVSSLLDKFDKLPLQQIATELEGGLAGINTLVNSDDMKQAIADFSKTMAQVEQLSKKLNTQTVPNANHTLRQASSALKSAEDVISQDSPLHHEILKALKDLSAAARSIRSMAEYLERHPDSLLRGKSSRR